MSKPKLVPLREPWTSLAHLKPQSRFGDKLLEIEVVCPKYGAVVLKGLSKGHYIGLGVAIATEQDFLTSPRRRGYIAATATYCYLYFIGILFFFTCANGNAKSKSFFFKHIAFKERPKKSSYRRCGKKEKKVFFLPFETHGEVVSSVLCSPAANCFFILRLVSSRHMTPAMVWRRWP